MLSERTKSMLPMPVRRWLDRCHRQYDMWLAVQQFAWGSVAKPLTPKLVRRFRHGWGNELWSAEAGYIGALVEHAWKSEGPILECGSGLTTVLLGLIAQRIGQRVWSLEHQPKWGDHVREALRKWRVRTVELCVDELHDYGPYTWYVPPQDRMPGDFSLVACDGPPQVTRGGRYGLLPVMRPRLRSGCVIIVDDADRPEDRATIQAWAKELGAEPSFIESRKGVALLRVP
ncbi:MAG: class I SAM-dependent methyltransferase [Verrucomicrobia bacterium]|nr:class I SAM-dependent methyltransferase [Verrucomicrobiota bacterium]